MNGIISCDSCLTFAALVLSFERRAEFGPVLVVARAEREQHFSILIMAFNLKRVLVAFAFSAAIFNGNCTPERRGKSSTKLRQAERGE